MSLMATGHGAATVAKGGFLEPGTFALDAGKRHGSPRIPKRVLLGN